VQGVEALIPAREFLSAREWEDARRTQSLERRLGPIVDAMHARAAALFGDELLDRLEEVDVQACEVVHASELGIGRLGGVAIRADERPDDRAVLLLDVGAVILVVGGGCG
jgi:hypothetical protein